MTCQARRRHDSQTALTRIDLRLKGRGKTICLLNKEGDVETKNVFISHIHEDEARLESLKKLIQQDGFSVRDGSLTSAKPNEAKNEAYIKSSIIAPQIQWASVLIVLISPETKHSEWVRWEIEYAQQLGKRVIGVWDHGAAGSDLPEGLDKFADAIVGWQGDRVRAAIRGELNEKEGPEGATPPPRPVPRYTC